MEVSWKDILEWTVKAGALGFTSILCILMAHHFVKKLVLDAIDEAKDMAKQSKKSTEQLAEKVSALNFSIMKQAQELNTTVTQEAGKMSRLFVEASNFAAVAKTESSVTSQHLKNHVSESDQKMASFGKVGHAFLEQLKTVKGEITEIKKDVFLIKTKKDNK